MSRGPAEAALCIGNNGTTEYRPKVRGVVVGATEPNAQKALRQAKLSLSVIANKAKSLPAIDELALGIDDTNRELFEACSEQSLRCDVMVHLGMALADSDCLSDECEALLEIAAEPQSTKKLLGEAMHKAVRFEDREDVIEALLAHKLFGFLAQYSTPMMTVHRDGKSRSFSWGLYTSAVIYGETIPELQARAVRWCKEVRAAELQEAKSNAAPKFAEQ